MYSFDDKEYSFLEKCHYGDGHILSLIRSSCDAISGVESCVSVQQSASSILLFSLDQNNLLYR
jgi:hypothetical protein